MNDEQEQLRPGREDYGRALQSMDTFVDVGVTDLITLSERRRPTPEVGLS